MWMILGWQKKCWLNKQNKMKLTAILQALSHSKFIWVIPRKSDVLVVDNASKELMLSLFRSWSVTFINTRDMDNERKEINVICALFAIVRVICNGGIVRKEQYINYYVDSYIRMVKPKIVATIIDNNRYFYSISLRNADVKTMFIQNASRYYYGALEYLATKENARAVLKVDYMFTLGSDIANQYYSKYIQGESIPIGTLKNNMIPRNSVLMKKDTISYSSQYRANDGQGVHEGKWFTYDEYFNKPTKFIVMYLMGYAEMNEKEFFIIPCANNALRMREERRYYKDLIGKECSFSRYKYGSYEDSYHDVDRAEVSVTLDCTMGFEHVARGGKNAFFSVRSSMIGQKEPYKLDFGWPKKYPNEGPFWTNTPDTKIFDRILDYLFEIDDNQWKEKLREHNFNNIITYDFGNKKMQAVIENELG